MKMPWRAITSLLWYFLPLVAFGLFVAGCFYALLGVLIKRHGASIAKWFRTNVPRTPYIALKTLGVMSELISESRRMGRVFVAITAFSAGIAVGWIGRDIHSLNNERGPYKIRIEQQTDVRHWWAYKLDDKDRPVGDPWYVAVCPHDLNPHFDVGCVYKVKFELVSTNIGYCESFSGDHAQADPVRCQ